MARFSLSDKDKKALDNALNDSTSRKELLVKLLNCPAIHTPPGIKGFFILALDYYYSKDGLTQNMENIIDDLVEFIISEDYIAWDCLADIALVKRIKALASNPANNTDDKLHEAWLEELASTVGPPTKIPPRP